MGLRGFVGLLAGRLIRRRGPTPRWAVRIGLGGLIVLLAAGVALAFGLRGPLVIASFWLASLAGMLALLVARLRPLLVISVLGLALGVASMFVVLGVGSGLETALIGSLARLNGHAVVNKYGLDFFEYEDVARTLEADPRVHAASPFVFGVGAIVVESVESEAQPLQVVVSIKGVDPQRLARFTGASQLFAVGGFDSLRLADPGVRPGIALGVRLAHRIGAKPGSIVRLVVPAEIRQRSDPNEPPRHGEFEVLGLIDTGFAEFDASFAVVHLRAAQAVVYGEARASGVEIELREPRLGAVAGVAAQLSERLNQPIVSQDMPPLYRAASWLERSETLISIRQTKALLAVIVGLIVVVASSSLIGALLLLVRRERPQIGVLAALGARPRQLFAAFELVGVLVGALGSGLGLALGSISLLALELLRFDLDPDIYMLDHLPVAFVLTDMLIPSGLAILVCAVVSGPIARQVGNTRPLELLG
jgi:lipoprotein-releasing system permease protein